MLMKDGLGQAAALGFRLAILVGDLPYYQRVGFGIDESDAELGDFIEDTDVPPPAESVAQTMLTEEIGDILDQLTPREARILRLRYGLQDGESRTLKEVGEMFGLSRERIRQLEKEALRKLRHPNFAGHLRQYLN
jgi:RNA polymerase primary sigma factor